MDSDLDSVLGNTDVKQIDFFVSSYYSFLYLKKNLLSNKLDYITKENLVPVRIIAVCRDADQFNSIVDFFKPLKNVAVRDVISFSESMEHMIAILINKCRLYFLQIDYDSVKRVFSKLSDAFDNKMVAFLFAIYDNMWNTLEKNIILEKRNIFQQDFVDISSHQLRNPILPIIGFSKTLKSKIKDPDMLEYLDIIIKNAEKLKNIANEILDISKIEANPSKLDLEIFDINEMLSNMVSDYNQLFRKDLSDINIVFQGRSNLLIEADREYIKQAFENVLNNSYFFTKKNKGNKIIVSVLHKNEDENSTTILIEDEGPGILDDDPDRVFTKFYPNSGGSGLGLFISKKIIEIHGGSIKVENRFNDIGAKFTINIPLKPTDFQLYNEIKSNNDLKILFIGDFENLKYINDELKTLGYEVDHFKDPYHAIECFIPGKYFLAFIGINVNGLDGFDLYDDLKKRDKNIKGYFISSNKINKEAMEFLNKNMMYDHFIYNPLSFTNVLEIVKREQY